MASGFASLAPEPISTAETTQTVRRRPDQAVPTSQAGPVFPCPVSMRSDSGPAHPIRRSPRTVCFASDPGFQYGVPEPPLR